MRKKKILILDDSISNLLLLHNLLEDEGYNVKSASKVKDFNKILKKYRPDLFLLDIMMPESNGFEIVKNLQLSPDFKKTPIIFVSAIKEISVVKQALSEGLAAYITKPLDFDEVIEKVKKCLE